ncbi:MAG: hypothetical protein Q9224_001496 [Gallowayella concinna]
MPPTPTPENITLSKQELEQCLKEAEEDMKRMTDEIREIDSEFNELNRGGDIEIYNVATGDGTHETVLSEEEREDLFEGFLKSRKEKAKMKKAALLSAEATSSSSVARTEDKRGK